MRKQPEGVIFSADTLVPAEWQSLAQAGPVRAFNPALLAHGTEFVFAYRFVAADGVRRIGLCRLDEALRVIPGSPRPLSDGFRLAHAEQMPEIARTWFADPRLYRLHGRVFVYWNSGWHEPRNYQFLQELDPATFHPIGEARELILATGERQRLEKNWTLFTRAADVGSGVGKGPDVFAVYSITPHRVLRVSLDRDHEAICSDTATQAWVPSSLPPCHGGLRGGTPPHEDDGGLVSLAHSVHDGPEGYRYCASAYRFAASETFTPTHEPSRLLELFNPYGARRLHPRLNPAVADVVYPCGLVRQGPHWLVSHGINDEHCAITRLPDEELRATLRPVGEPADR